MTIIRVVMMGALLSLTACGGFLGSNNSAFQKIGKGTYSAEAEDLEASNEFEVNKDEKASGGETLESTGDGEAKTKFEGDDGIFTMVMELEGEDDGESKIEIRVNEEKIKEFTLGEEKEETEGDSEENDLERRELDNKEIVVIDDIELKEGDEIKIIVEKEDGEKVEMDRITLIEEQEVEREQIGDRIPERERRLREFLENQDSEKEVSEEVREEESDEESEELL